MFLQFFQLLSVAFRAWELYCPVLNEILGKMGLFSPPKYTCVLLHSNPVQQKYLSFFQTFYETVRWLRANENKISDENALNCDYFGN